MTPPLLRSAAAARRAAALVGLGLAFGLALAAPSRARAAPLTLDDALSEAARGNADLAFARASRDAAGVDLYQSWSGVLPRLDLTGAFGRQFISGQESVNVVPSLIRDPSGAIVDIGYAQQVVQTAASDFGAHQLGLALRWTFFDGFATWRAVASSRAAARAADRSLDEASLQVAFTVASRFYEVVKQDLILKVRQETVDRSEELVRRADALFTAGRGNKADTFAARVNLGNDRIAVEAQRAQVIRARADLALALGRDADDGLEVVAPAGLSATTVPPQEEPPPVAALLERARAARPLLAARAGSVEAAEAAVEQARGGYWPQLGLLGSYNRQSTELTGPSGVFGDPSRQYVALAQVTLTWNLFQGRQTAAAEQRAAVQARRARADSRLAAETVSSEISRARAAVATLARAAALSHDNLAAAGEGLRLARERLEAGVASQLEVRDATLKLAEAKLSLVSALVDHAVARADLNRAVGGSL